MIKLNLQQIKNSAHLFKGISDTALTSCLEGLMGDVYGESENPKMAIAFLGYIYIGGVLDKAFLNEFMNFIGKIRQNEKAVFLGKVIFFYLLLMILWMHFMLAKDSAAPAFIYEQF